MDNYSEPRTPRKKSPKKREGDSADKAVQVDLEMHIRHLEKSLAAAKTMKVAFVNSRTGHDWWPTQVKVEFLQKLGELAEKLEVKVCHETHRGGMFSSPWVAAELLAAVPGLLLHVNLGAWCCAAGRVLSVEQHDPRWKRVVASVASSAFFVNAQISDGREPQVCHPADVGHERTVKAYVPFRSGATLKRGSDLAPL